MRSIYWVLTASLVLVSSPLFLRAQADRNLERPKAFGAGEKRLALVIGNGSYLKARSLANPANDATDVAATLSGLGFEVISGTNLSLKQMNDKVREFGDRLKAGGGVGLFYYAGHGIQVSGRNYLIPVDADIPREDEVDFAAMNLEVVLRKMATANNGLNIVVLDACRNNPFARSWSRGDDGGGLAQVSAPTGTFIAYATSPDKTASDGSGRNGLYTSQLLKVIKQPGLKIEEAFKQVTIGVDQASQGNQIPWTSSSLRGEFYFKLSGVRTAGPILSGEPVNRVKAGPANSPTPGAVRQNSIGMDLVYIPPGEFVMGSPDTEKDRYPREGPQHRVSFKSGFWMGRFEVTQAQWRAVMADSPSNFKNCDDCPVENVSWQDAMSFVGKLNQKNDGLIYGLPTEAQWEYAARAGSEAEYYGMLDEVAWYNRNANSMTHPVGQKQPNAFGLYDMHGNVWEWCEDILSPDYNGLPSDGTANVKIGDADKRVTRGGAWSHPDSVARAALRSGDRPAMRVWSVGVRVTARPR